VDLEVKREYQSIDIQQQSKKLREAGPKLLEKDFSKPIKTEVLDKKASKLISNPQNFFGNQILREKYNLPQPVLSKVRNCGIKMDMGRKLFSAKSISS
jgi:hypothetical protein